jgi:hypothetical protein
MRPSGEFGFRVTGKRRRSPEFPCVSRFRQRRLISFLAHHKFYRTVDMYATHTHVFPLKYSQISAAMRIS